MISGLGRSAEEGIGYPLQYSWASLVTQLIKNLPAMQERDLGLIPQLGRPNTKIKSLLTPVFWPGEFHGLYMAQRVTRLSDFHFSLLYNVVLVSDLQQSESTINGSIHGLPW